MAIHSSQSMVVPLRQVIVKRPEEAFVDDQQIDAQWMALDYLSRPDLSAAIAEHRAFIALIEAAGAEVIPLPADRRTGMDSLYVHDPIASVTDQGVILAHMGKSARLAEPDAMEEAFVRLGIPILGRVLAPGTIEGGDVVWLNKQKVAVGLTYRTNAEGIRQFRELTEPLGVTVIEVPMVHWDGPGAVLHLMSVISLVDTNLAVVYERLLPIPFRHLLIEMGFEFVQVPDEEYDSLGCNVLAVGPRHVLIRAGNPTVVRRLRDAGCRVEEFAGDHICYTGSGGPTCLTRPVWRA